MSHININQDDLNYKACSHFSYALGTLIYQKISSSKAKTVEIIKEVIKLIDRLEKIMSFYNINSQISQINQQAGKAWTSVSPESLLVIKEAKRYARLTKGLFDITIAVLVNLWQQYGKVGQLPPHHLIEEALTKINYEDILIEEEKGRVKLQKEKQKIDLGGIAKGYIANCVIELYRENRLHSAIVNLGGNVAVLGKREDGKLWQVGIQDPEQKRGKCLATVAVSDTSVVTSGNYERFYLEGNRKYHHILNPFTGYPSNSGLNSVTIIYPDAMLADVLSTAIFIAGLEEGINLLCHYADVEAIMVNNHRQIYFSRGILSKFQLIEEGYNLYQF
ncbi:MAG: FAD:protein FMN transferase [Atribacterota bacterium]|nr:FAD:protein FMN transferase [Atribacterota bacterium]MDD4895659.1 FAD:protein FMN transferase [Atribacterota bacterium]MDD5637341.1 FAD:protein FMN transferase [Atribacterota bacterium]